MQEFPSTATCKFLEFNNAAFQTEILSKENNNNNSSSVFFGYFQDVSDIILILQALSNILQSQKQEIQSLSSHCGLQGLYAIK